MSIVSRRVVIPVLVTAVAASVVLVSALPKTMTPETASPALGVTETYDQGEVPEEDGPQPAAIGPAPDEVPAVDDTALEPDPPDVVIPGESAGPVHIVGLHAVATGTGRSGEDEPSESLGSLDPMESRMEVQFSLAGAGIESITFSDIWQTVHARRIADAHHAAIAEGRTPDASLPEEFRYILHEAQVLNRGSGDLVRIPDMAVNAISVNGQMVNLFHYDRDEETQEKQYIWAELEAGRFSTSILNEDGDAVLRIDRRFLLTSGYDITIQQRLTNLTSESIDVTWYQYGPADLALDRNRYMDRRRYRFGYVYLDGDPERKHVLSDDQDLVMDRQKVVKLEDTRLWPNETSTAENYGLSWFSVTNRYFGLTVHPVIDAEGNGNRTLEGIVEEIVHEKSASTSGSTGKEDLAIFTYLVSPERRIEAGETLALDMGLFAGPLDRIMLAEEEPYRSLGMLGQIQYLLSSMCSFCTFQWLAKFLLLFMAFLKSKILFDWGLAIIGTTMLVRALLHPVSKRSQIGMQRFGKQMQKVKPELDVLKKKFGDDPKRMQQEQMRLMREHNINPAAMLGCLPMFLQTPIWIALYAMLYFTFDIRQEPAFFGLFQAVTGGAWPFLSDLSASDHFFGTFDEPIKFLFWNLTGINLLPILMGAIFYFQQKYTSPSAATSPEQEQTQKIMRVMIVFMFPVFLYSAPSGLTLYILTSSTIGILEGRYIRKLVNNMDLTATPKKKSRKEPQATDAQGRAYTRAVSRMERRREAKKSGPDKKFKKRR